MNTVDDILRVHYPISIVTDMLRSGAQLPTEPCPPWYRPLKRRRWVRRTNAAIAQARIYGWRTDKGPARDPLLLANLLKMSGEFETRIARYSTLVRPDSASNIVVDVP